jgi:ribosomal protein L11 methyltransferase
MSYGARKTAKVAVATLISNEQSGQKFTDAVSESLADDGTAVSLVDAGRGRWQVTVYFRTAPDRKALRALAVTAAGPKAGNALRFARVAAKDWAKDWAGASLAGLTPVAAGRFVVHGAHDRTHIPRNRIGIEIEAALAFGTGHHGTTRGCLLALDWLCRSRGNAPLRILDLGTGSGVLAIAAARALRRRVLATDVDAVAVRAARDNARLNHAGPLIEVVKANGLTAPAIRAAAPFDLIFANILLEPLQRLAAPQTKIIAPGGRIVLSGLLTSQATAAIVAYRALALERRIDIDGWTTLVLRRAPAC